MTIVEEHLFPVGREELWASCTTRGRWRNGFPGCERLEEIGPDRYAATLRVGVAAIKGSYTGFVEIRDKQFPDRYSLAVEGNAARDS